MYRGVTRHRWSGRFEAHLWDKSSWNNIQKKKGRQVYLGAYDNEDAAARTYDLAALKYWGTGTILNFPVEFYAKELEEMANVSKEEYLASLRRQSSGFSRGISRYRGVARHHHNGRWEARIGRVLGNKYLYLGTYNTQEEAAAAYDMAALEHRGTNAVTNFDISCYIERLRSKGIMIDADQAPQQQQQGNEEIPQCLDTIDAPMIIVNEMEDQDLWNFCTDTQFNPYPVLDVPFTGEDSDLIDCISFEDDVEFMFGNEVGDEYGRNEANGLDPRATDVPGAGAAVGGSGNVEEEDNVNAEGVDSPASTTTLVVSCDYFV